MFLFMIVGKKDAPLFEAELQAGLKADGSKPDPNKKDETHLPNFLIHASLDVVEEVVWKNSSLFVLSTHVHVTSMAISCEFVCAPFVNWISDRLYLLSRLLGT